MLGTQSVLHIAELLNLVSISLCLTLQALAIRFQMSGGEMARELKTINPGGLIQIHPLSSCVTSETRLK